ncbi:hypothetical protein ACKLNO_06495 [Neisseriaceae bacterium B1]
MWCMKGSLKVSEKASDSRIRLHFELQYASLLLAAICVITKPLSGSLKPCLN